MAKPLLRQTFASYIIVIPMRKASCRLTYLGIKRQARFATGDSGNLFLTLDYSTFPMDSYFGRIVSLDSLKLENKRSDDEIRESAGRLKGEILSENCPHCGAPVHWPSGVISFLLCQSCGSSLNTTKRYCLR